MRCMFQFFFVGEGMFENCFLQDVHHNFQARSSVLTSQILKIYSMKDVAFRNSFNIRSTMCFLYHPEFVHMSRKGGCGTHITGH